MKNKLFIFGANGYLGKALANNLKNYKDIIKVGRNIDGLYFDLETSNPEDLQQHIGNDDVWIFLSAVSSPTECEMEFDYSFNINVTKTKNLIDWLTENGVRVIFASSDAVFGKNQGISCDDDVPNPLGAYAHQKALIEKYVKDNNLVKVARFSYIFGQDDKFSSLIKISEESKKKLDIYIGFKRCVVLLDDVIYGIDRLIRNWNSFNFKYINFCGPELIDRADMANILREKFFPNFEYINKEPPEKFWEGRAKKINLDCKNFTKILGRRPKSINQI